MKEGMNTKSRDTDNINGIDQSILVCHLISLTVFRWFSIGNPVKEDQLVLFTPGCGKEKEIIRRIQYYFIPQNKTAIYLDSATTQNRIIGMCTIETYRKQFTTDQLSIATRVHWYTRLPRMNYVLD